MPVTLKQLAVQAQVHPSTISRVANHDPSLRIAPQTRQRIETLLRETEYRPNGVARGLKLRHAGESTTEGRRVVRYAVAGSGARAGEKDESDLPPPHYPENRIDPDTGRRLELWDKEEPVTVSGTVVIDAQTAAPLGCDLRGRFRVAGDGAAPVAEMSVHSVLVTSAIGKDPKLKAPEAEPEPSVPHAVKDPLRFLRKGPGAAPPAEEPDEGEEEEAAPQR